MAHDPGANAPAGLERHHAPEARWARQVTLRRQAEPVGKRWQLRRPQPRALGPKRLQKGRLGNRGEVTAFLSPSPKVMLVPISVDVVMTYPSMTCFNEWVQFMSYAEMYTACSDLLRPRATALLCKSMRHICPRRATARPHFLQKTLTLLAPHPKRRVHSTHFLHPVSPSPKHMLQSIQ